MDLFNLDPPRDGLPAALAWGFREARILQVAMRVGLFAALAERPRSAQRLATLLQTDADMTERLLVALAALGLVVCEHGQWRNGLAASLHLLPGQPLFQGDLIEMAAVQWDFYHDLERLVREGRGDEAARLRDRLAEQERYRRAFHDMAMAGEGQRLARTVGALAGRRTLLDVGGAPGTFSVALCQRFPILRATVLDGADAQPLFEQVVGQFKLAERLALKVGDWRADDFGRGEWEAILFSHRLAGSESQALEWLVRGHDALKPQGLLIVQGFWLDSDLNGGRSAALANIVESAFTLEQMRSLVAEAGFERSALLFRDGIHSDILVAFKPSDETDMRTDALMEHISPEQETFAVMGLGDRESDGLTLQRQAWRRLVGAN